MGILFLHLNFCCFSAFTIFLLRTYFVRTSEAQIFKKLRIIQEQQQARCKQSKNIMTIWLFETEMLEHKYIHSILQQNKFNTNNIMFKFRNLYAPFMDENMYIMIWIPQIWKKWIISGISRRFSTFTPKIWISHPPLIIPFFLVDSCCKNKIRTDELEIQWKYKNSEPQP